MGDRSNVFIKERYQEDPNVGVYLYTHWGGDKLPKDVHAALSMKCRWRDSPYLARIIFRQMGAGKEGETGLGISLEICDNEHKIIYIDCQKEEISLADGELNISHSWSFAAFVENPEPLFKKFQQPTTHLARVFTKGNKRS